MNNLSIKFMVLLFAGCLTAAFLTGSCSVRRSVPIEGPLALEDSSVVRGRIQFMAKCHRCHPVGESGLGLAINSNPAPGFLKRFQVRHGLGVMPAFGDKEITGDELDDIISYLKALRRNN